MDEQKSKNQNKKQLWVVLAVVGLLLFISLAVIILLILYLSRSNLRSSNHHKLNVADSAGKDGTTRVRNSEESGKEEDEEYLDYNLDTSGKSGSHPFDFSDEACEDKDYKVMLLLEHLNNPGLVSIDKVPPCPVLYKELYVGVNCPQVPNRMPSTCSTLHFENECRQLLRVDDEGETSKQAFIDCLNRRNPFQQPIINASGSLEYNDIRLFYRNVSANRRPPFDYFLPLKVSSPFSNPVKLLEKYADWELSTLQDFFTDITERPNPPNNIEELAWWLKFFEQHPEQLILIHNYAFYSLSIEEDFENGFLQFLSLPRRDIWILNNWRLIHEYNCRNFVRSHWFSKSRFELLERKKDQPERTFTVEELNKLFSSDVNDSLRLDPTNLVYFLTKLMYIPETNYRLDPLFSILNHCPSERRSELLLDEQVYDLIAKPKSDHFPVWNVPSKPNSHSYYCMPDALDEVDLDSQFLHPKDIGYYIGKKYRRNINGLCHTANNGGLHQAFFGGFEFQSQNLLQIISISEQIAPTRTPFETDDNFLPWISQSNGLLSRARDLLETYRTSQPHQHQLSEREVEDLLWPILKHSKSARQYICRILEIPTALFHQEKGKEAVYILDSPSQLCQFLNDSTRTFTTRLRLISFIILGNQCVLHRIHECFRFIKCEFELDLTGQPSSERWDVNLLTMLRSSGDSLLKDRFQRLWNGMEKESFRRISGMNLLTEDNRLTFGLERSLYPIYMFDAYYYALWMAPFTFSFDGITYNRRWDLVKKIYFWFDLPNS